MWKRHDLGYWVGFSSDGSQESTELGAWRKKIIDVCGVSQRCRKPSCVLYVYIGIYEQNGNYLNDNINVGTRH